MDWLILLAVQGTHPQIPGQFLIDKLPYVVKMHMNNFVLPGVELKIALGATLIFSVERSFSQIFLVFPRDQCV